MDILGNVSRNSLFQDMELSLNEYRNLILRQILGHDKDDMIVHGYIRIYIELSIGIIPLVL